MRFGGRGLAPAARGIAAAACLAALAPAVPPAGADPVPGFVEEWPTDASGWAGGTEVSNPGTGGLQGAGDGYLRVANTGPGPFGARSFAAAYAGDWIAAGILSVRVWLRDVDADDALEIHFSIGTNTNLWQADLPMAPPTDAWQEYVIDLTSPAGFTQVRGAGTFAEALRAVDRVHFRHDVAPYEAEPEHILASLGVDHLELTSINVPTIDTTWGRIKALYRGEGPRASRR